MSKFLHVCGVVLAGVGLALGVLGVASPGQLAIYGLTAETAAILLVGGILSVGLGSVINVLASGGSRTAAAVPEFAPSRLDPPSDASVFKRRTHDVVSGIGKVGAAAAGASVLTEAVANDIKAAPSNSVAETIEALEQAKSDIKAALGESQPIEPESLNPLPVKPETQIPAPIPEMDLEPELQEPDETAEEAEPEESGLYVVEEQVVRGKPARILSDGTVEAETDEGWMRFENLEHLNEYLDSLT